MGDQFSAMMRICFSTFRHVAKLFFLVATLALVFDGKLLREAFTMVTHRMCSELTIVPAFAETATQCQQLVASSLAADAIYQPRFCIGCSDEPIVPDDLPLSPSPVAGERRVSGVRLSEPSSRASCR